MSLRLHDVLTDSARAGLSLLDDGKMPAGHNGPHGDPETPVRNSSHWLLVFLKAYEVTDDPQYATAANNIATYLCSDEVRPEGETFYHRDGPDKDSCNGLIGQAWTIEALAKAGQVLDRTDALQIAEEVFLRHPFDESKGLWKRVDIDGTILPFDMTFNHQLWFAACAGMLPSESSGTIDSRIRMFLDEVEDRLETTDDGLILHPVAYQSWWRNRARSVRNRLQQRNDFEKCIGYHAFNLYGFALLKREYPDHPFWSSSQFQQTLDFVESEDYAHRITSSKYGYPYNPPGFEVPFALHTFDRASEDELSKWVSEQLSRCFDSGRGLMTRNTPDEMTHAARIYEATRLPDLEVQLQIDDSR